jgi:hypothetical protein
MTKAWKFILATAAIVALVVLALIGRGGSIGARLAAYLRKRDDAEARARAAADAALSRLDGHIVDSNREVHDAAIHPADAINGTGR